MILLYDDSSLELGPRFGKDRGREDLVLLGSLSWDKSLQYGRIGSKYNMSFDSVCGELAVGFTLLLLVFKIIKRILTMFCSTNL